MVITHITVEEVYFIHEKMVKIGGGKSGIHDFNLLLSAIQRPQTTFGQKYIYPDIWTQGASLIHSLIQNHPFVDGNKRTAYFSTMRFLNINGYVLHASQDEVLAFCLSVANRKLQLQDISEWLKKHVSSL